MDFYAVLDQVTALLRQRQRVTYRALQRQFGFDDAYLVDLKAELIDAQRLAADEEGKVLVWAGDACPTISTLSLSATVQERAPLTYTPSYLAEKVLTSRNALEGERKQITVLFADLKGSMELLAERDPEDARQLLDPVLERMMAAVHRYEGTVNQVMGDGIMALFGAPLAHEDHAVRACYAALAMQDAISRYGEEVRRSHGVTVQIRVGLNSGEVVVRAISNDLHMDYSAVGQTTHLAARMEQLAAPGSVVLTAATLRLVEGLVRVKSLGPIPVKGISAPVEVYELIGASSTHRRLQAAVAHGLTKFVGRDVEIDALNQALELAGTGHGQIVAAVGEAGVGKSRLTYEFIHSHRTRGWRVLESASVSYGKATPYFPVIDLLKHYVHMEDGDDARTIRAKVTGQILTLDERLQDTIPALLSLLDALPEDSPFLQLDPPQRRQRTFDGLKRILLRESQVQPLVLVFEDLHWHDSESQALLNSVVESLPTATLLLLVNYRPEYQHSWGSQPFYTHLQLDPLPPESADALLAALLGEDPSLEPLKQLLIERTEGNPFFLEESVRTLVEMQVLVGRPGAYWLEQALPRIQVPATVQAMLAARIDRLPQDDKSLLQTASVIGSEVPLSLLQAIAELSEAGLYCGLTNLQASAFLYETSLFPEHVYTFKHALTHEVAYSSVLQERRRVLHGRIVEALETLYSERLAEQVERLAHHAVRGELWDKALGYCQQAGEKAMARSAYREAVGYFEQALSARQHLPEQQDTREQAIDLRIALHHVRLILGEPAEHLLQELQEAERLVEALDDPDRLGWVSQRLSDYCATFGPYDRAIAYGQRALILAAARGDIGLHVSAHISMGLASFNLHGDYRQAMNCLRQAIAALEGEQRYEFFGMSRLPAGRSHTFMVYCLAAVGEFAEGMALGTEGLRLAEAVNHPRSLVTAYLGVGCLHIHKGELHQALSILERALSLCQEMEILWEFPIVAEFLGSAYVLSGRVDEAVRLLEQATQGGPTGGRPSLRLTLSEGYLLAGRFEEASTLANSVLERARIRKQRSSEAHALRLLGDIAAQRKPPESTQAEAYYRQALTLTNELGMRPLQAHCHRGLGTLYRQTRQLEQARSELTTAIEMYRDMEMLFWLPETEAALAAVEGKA